MLQWILITVGVSLLAVGALLSWLLTHRNAASYVRASLPKGMLALIRKAACLSPDQQDHAALADFALALLEHIHQLRIQLRRLPALPEASGEPRLMELARDAADANQYTLAALLRALDAWEHTAAPSEIQGFPACIAAAQCQRLRRVLQTMLADAKIRRQAEKLARRLHRSKQPYARLDKAGLNSLGLASLANALRSQEQAESLVLLDRWLEVHEITAEDLAEQDALRQVQLAEEIRRALNCFSSLAQLPWMDHCETADALHPLLMKDPSGIYPAMTPESRLQLRLQAELLSRHVHLDAIEIIRHALLLCEDAEPHALEQYVGYWLQEADGLRILYRTLPTRRGRVYARFALRRGLLRYILRLALGLLFGFGFLHSGEPVFMLPFFLLVTGFAIRLIANQLQTPPLPQMDATPNARPIKTLVVLPAVLHDQHEAIRMVRLLRTASHTCTAAGTDYLLLGDFAPNMTAVSSNDGLIMQAAVSAVSAIQDELPIHYLQRGRTWDADQHTYCARGGYLAALSELCRLIVQGECADAIACATLEPASLERKYDFIYVLSPQQAVLPGMLQSLLQRMLHPLCCRYPTGHGWRGFSVLSPGEEPVFQGTGLLLPSAFLEATDGLLPSAPHAAVLSGELAGYAAAGLQANPPHPSSDDRAAQYASAQCAWALLPWQLPWVRTPTGVLGNPLTRASKFRLRDLLREALLPLGQLGLALWAVLTQSWLMLLLSLLLPEVFRIRLSMRGLLYGLARLSLLPTRALIAVLPVWFSLPWNRSKSPQWPVLEIWAQGLTATVFAALGLTFPSFSLPALLLAAVFACFPLAHQLIHGPARKEEGLTSDHIAMLEDAATSTWRYFTAHVNAASRYLPPCAVQFEPAHPVEAVTSPEAIGAYLLACVSAKELALLSASAAAERVQQVLAALRDLPQPFGLPCQRYTLPALTVADAKVDAAASGFFAAALMTTIQALRTWLPELPPAFAHLSAEAGEILAALDLSALYNPDSGLFYTALDAEHQPEGIVFRFADRALLLVLAAAARKEVPASCLQKLRRTLVKFGRHEVPLSNQGTASEHLLAGLFLPLDDADAAAFIEAMAAQGTDGIFGQDLCYTRRFDPHLRYQQEVHSLQKAAAHPGSAAAIFAPYAAALALPFRPRLAAEALHRYCALGAKGPAGFCDAIDCTDAPVLIGLHDSFHQGLLLCAAAHLLADAPLRRYFCALPEVEALLPQLHRLPAALSLPPLPRSAHSAAEATEAAIPVDPLQQPVPRYLLGTSPFHMLADAHGSAHFFDHDVQLNKALHFYLADEGRIYRLGDPRLPGEVHFKHGELCIEQVCGSLRSELIVCADTLRQRAVHVITVTNLSTRDRTIELTDLLLPDMNVPVNTLEPTRPATDHLILHARGTDQRLHHTVSASAPTLRTTVCTDAPFFFGRGGSLQHPSLLDIPADNVLRPSSEPCLSFRIRVVLGGRGQTTLWYTTSLQDHTPPLLTELFGLRHLCTLQHTAIQTAAALTAQQHRTALLMLPFLQHGQQPVSLIVEDITSSPLQDLLAILGWLLLHGLKIKLCIHCPEHLQDDISSLLPAKLAEEQVHFAPSGLPTYPLCLMASISLDAQLEALRTGLTFPQEIFKAPVPAQLPQQELLYGGPYGGFDPNTLDYMIQLEPCQMPPFSWSNRHVTRYFQDETDETGLKSPFQEQVWIQMEDGAVLSPWSRELPRSIRMRPGETDWEAWSDQLDLRLRAACLPGHRCGLRSLHIHNAADSPLHLRIFVLAHLGRPLVCTPAFVITDCAENRLQAFMAGSHWQARRVIPARLDDGPACIYMPDNPHGSAALLSCEMTLAAGRGDKVFWLAGFARHGEDAARALAQAQSATISDHLREAHLHWARCLERMRITTPEGTLDLLMNRILPWQALSAEGVRGVPALKYISPGEARRALLRQARQPMNRDEWAAFILTAAAYVRVAQDEDILNVHLPIHNSTLLDACRSAVMSVPLNHQNLPLGDDQPRRCFLYTLAAQALNALRADEEALALNHTLLNAADTYLWQDGYYATPLRLDVQTLACAAYGANPRTRQAITTCWMTLYDQLHGLIRTQEVSDIPPLPGLPENGGMVTLEAVRCLHALLKTARYDEAFELLRALNPLHHTDTPHRQEIFRAAPFRLHGGMYASPMDAGRATPDGDEAAALLYAIVLEDILGFRRKGNVLSLHPCVPDDWDDFTITLQEGSSTWHISAERRTTMLTIDGQPSSDKTLHLTDDGKIHHVHFPLA